MRIAILGFGREGRAILKYLKKNKAYKNAEIWILDHSQSYEVGLRKIGIKCINGSNYLNNLKEFDLVFRSPGVPYNLPEIQSAKKSGVKISSATKLFFESASERDIHIIGITGTKGKGTTSTLLYNIFRTARRSIILAGNIGKPAIEILPRLKPGTTVILELSSFQLQDLEKSPQTAAVLEIFPDHMDSHKNFAEYLSAKSNISAHQNKKDRVFYSSGNKNAKHIAELSQGKITAVSEKSWSIFSPDDLKVPGAHNFKNAVMAATIALAHGLPKTAIIRAVKNFRGLPHRLELIRTLSVIPLIRPNKGDDKSRKNCVIRFYNDSASTNPQTAAAAIRAFSEPTILIAGGKDKNLDYAPLAHAVSESKNLKAIILFGENKNKIAAAVIARGSGTLAETTRQSHKNIKIIIVKDLKSAVSLAYREAKKLITYNLQPITNVIFSPGSASFDMFRDYADRGEKFKEVVKKLG